MTGRGVRSKVKRLWVTHAAQQAASQPQPHKPAGHEDMVVRAQLIRVGCSKELEKAQHPPNTSFLRKARAGLVLGGGISHRECYFLENQEYPGQVKAISKVTPDTLSKLSQKVISNSL